MNVPENDPRLRDAAARAENRHPIDPDAPPEVIESQIDAKRADISRTLSQLEQRFSPNQMFDYVRDNGGEVAENLGRSFKRNPVPFIVTGIGLAWLMSTTQGGARDDRDYRRYRSHYYGDGGRYAYDDDDYGEARYGRDAYGRDPYDRGPYDRDDFAGSGMDEYDRAAARADAAAAFGSGTSDTTPYASRQSAYAAGGPVGADADGDDEGLLDKARAKAGELGESVSDGVDSLKERVGAGRDRAADHYERMRTDARYRADSLRRDASRRYAAMRASGRDAGYRARYRARRGMDQASDFLQEQPLVAAAVGIAVGALIGSLLPATRTEDRYLGEYSDEARGRAADLASERAEQLRDEAGRVARDVRESAEQSLSEARRTAEDKLEQTRREAERGIERADAKADEQGARAEAKVDERTTTTGAAAGGPGATTG